MSPRASPAAERSVTPWRLREARLGRLVSRWSVRQKIRLLPAVAASTLFLILLMTVAFGFVSERRAAEIEHGFYPSVQTSRTLSELLTRLQRGMQDAVAAREPDRLLEADTLADSLLHTVDGARDNPLTDRPALQALRASIAIYYVVARHASERLIAGDGGDSVLATLGTMTTRYNALRQQLDRRIRRDQSGTEAAFWAVRRLELAMTVAIALLGVLCVGLLWVLSSATTRSIVEPLGELVGVARRLADGDLTARSGVPDGDEIGALAAAFNRMAADLEAQVSAIRERDRLFSLSADLVCVVTLDGWLTQVNPAWSRLGYGDAALVGGSLLDLVHPDDRGRTRAAFDVLARGTSVTLEIRCQSADGTFRDLVWNATPVPEGRTVYAIGHDVTDRKAIEAALGRARDTAVESARLKAEFLANMSHEIRTPMNGVIGVTGMLLDTELTSFQRECADTIRGSADGLLTIINDILDFSKIEAGKLVFEDIDFGLGEVLESSVDLLGERARAKGLELALLIDQDVPMWLRGDPGRLRQILVNLIANAVKFTERGEIVVRVSTDVETPAGATLRFAVRDTGIGVSSTARRRLFAAFSQADGSMTRRYGGTGLGLAISKQLVDRMHGTIDVDSVEGEGSTFWFTAMLERGRETHRPPEASHAVDLVGIRVLVVDDHPTGRMVVRHQLSALGVVSAEAATGAETLSSLRHGVATGAPYDVALLDMQLPDVDGLAVARTIKGDAAIAPTRLILLTSLSQRPTADILGAAGIELCLHKPVKQSQLHDSLASVIAAAKRRSGGHAIGTGRAVSDQQQPLHELLLGTGAGVSAAGTASVQRRRLRILVAEDNAINQKVAVHQLTKLGYHADTVANGLEALAALETRPYAAILMDCQMPEMDGFEATAEIRRRELTNAGSRRTVIIAMTASAMEGDREECLAAGMDGYVSKPAKLADLEAVLGQFLGAAVHAG